MESALMSVAEVSKALGCTPQKVRMRIKLGIWKFGECVPKNKTGKKQDEYIIYRKKFMKFFEEE